MVERLICDQSVVLLESKYAQMELITRVSSALFKDNRTAYFKLKLAVSSA